MAPTFTDDRWFPTVPEPLPPGPARAALPRRHLAAFAPATTTDLRWWTGWAQRPGGEVVLELLDDVGSQAAELLAAQAARLTTWLDGTVATPRFPSPLSRRLGR